MSWWSWLIGPRGPEPISRIDDSMFESLIWSENEEAWVGEYGGFRIGIGYTGSEKPAAELLKYSREFLGPYGATFTRNLSEARTAHAHQFQRWDSEFTALQVGTLRFVMFTSGVACIVELIGGARGRSWRTEFDGMRCCGFAFDT